MLITVTVGLSACASKPDYDQGFDPTGKIPLEVSPLPVADPNQHLKSALGLKREPADLGFQDAKFNPCTYGLNDGGCHKRYFSVVHFQLLCRDSEGTVTAAPKVEPITADKVNWQVEKVHGSTATDAQGFGQFSVVSDRPLRGKRLILRIGSSFVGFTVSEVSKVVLPKNFCRNDHVAYR